MALGEFLEVNEFATLLFAFIEGQSIQSLIGHVQALRCLSVPLERAIVDLVGPLDRCDHLHAGVPRIHQDDPDHLSTALEDTVEHLQVSILLRPSRSGSKRRKIENPEALQSWVDVNTGDHSDAGNHCMDVAAPLSSYHLNEMGLSLVKHRVVKQ